MAPNMGRVGPARQAGPLVAQQELMSTDLVQLARAADYAARQHIAQRRKGERAEPYVNHLIEVAALLAEATAGDDVVLLMGGLLHDTLEDTDTTYEDLEQRFGAEVAALVAEVTDDKSLPKEERKRLQITKTPGKSRRAKLLKIADKTSNLRGLMHKPAGGMDRGAAARLCRVGRAGGAVMPRAQSRAGGRLRCRPRRGEPALRLRRPRGGRHVLRCRQTRPRAGAGSAEVADRAAADRLDLDGRQAGPREPGALQLLQRRQRIPADGLFRHHRHLRRHADQAQPHERRIDGRVRGQHGEREPQGADERHHGDGGVRRRRAQAGRPDARAVHIS